MDGIAMQKSLRVRKEITKRHISEDAASIKQHVAEHGVVELPPAAAAQLGESSPGWRHEVAERAERRAKFIMRRDGGVEGYQDAIAERLGAPRFIKGHKAPKRKKRQTIYIVCRFFDKVCVLRPIDSDSSAAYTTLHLGRLTAMYGVVGARFYLATERPYTEHSWKTTVGPLLRRRLDALHAKKEVLT